MNRSEFEIFYTMLLFNVNYLGHLEELKVFKHTVCLYFGNLEDSGNDVGDFFAHKVMQIPNLDTVFESEEIWNFLYHATP